MNIAFYISSHGFGHATRTAALIQEFIKAGTKCFVVTDRPTDIFMNCDSQYFFLRNGATDFGMIQNGWLEADITTTKVKLLDLWQEKEAIILRELTYCKDKKIDLIICDIPFLPFEVASRLNIPSCGISNFDWHFIYSNGLKADDKVSDNLEVIGTQLTAFENDIDLHFVVEAIGEYYKKADFAIRLPFSNFESMNGFKKIIDGDMLAAFHSEKEREIIKKEVKKDFRLKKDYEVILITFGGYGGNGINLPALYKTGKYIFAKEFGNYKVKNYTRCRIIPEDYPFENIMAAADCVITKTGYSTFAEAVKQQKKIIYTGRNGNPEDKILLDGIADYPLGNRISPSELDKADWVKIFAELDDKKEKANDQVDGQSPDYKGNLDYCQSNRKVASCVLSNLFKSKTSINKINPDQRHVIIDVGSNNVQLLWANITQNKIIPVHRAIRTSALAKDMKDGILALEGISRAKEILRDYIDFSTCYTERINVIGTSCSRESSNVSILSEWLHSEYGLAYNIISEEKEALLAGLANRKEFQEHPELLFFDIGGGSTEFVYYKHDEIVFHKSIPLGIRRVINEAKHNHRKQLSLIIAILSKMEVDISPQTVVVGIGGTVTNISAVKHKLQYYDGDRIHKTGLTLHEINNYIVRFSKMSKNEVKQLMPFEPERAEIIGTGLRIVAEIMERFKRKKILVSDYGILFGAAEEIRTAKYKPQ